MSILIPGMKMPKDCRECPFFGYTAEDDFMCLIQQDGEDACRLEEIPPHGRLIDADALMAEFEQMQKLNDTRGHEFACSFMSSGMEISTEWYCVEDAVNAAKTIIPADQEGGSGNV